MNYRAVLILNKEEWVKKSDDYFDLSMGPLDSAWSVYLSSISYDFLVFPLKLNRINNNLIKVILIFLQILLYNET